MAQQTPPRATSWEASDQPSLMTMPNADGDLRSWSGLRLALAEEPRGSAIAGPVSAHPCSRDEVDAPSGEPNTDALPSLAGANLSQLDSPQFTVGFETALVGTKLHFRKGAPGVPGTDLTSTENGTHGFHFGTALRMAFQDHNPVWGGETSVGLELQDVFIDSDATLDFPHSFGGTTINRVGISANFYDFALDVRQHVQLADWLGCAFGGTLEYQALASEFQTDAGAFAINLKSTFVAPRITLTAALTEHLEVNLDLGGFETLQLAPDADRVDDLHMLGASMRWHRNELGIELGVRQQELDLVREPGKPEETFVHSRLDTIFLGLSMRF